MKKVHRSSGRRASNRPTKYKQSKRPKCGAVTRGADVTRGKVRDGHPCRRTAGHGTDHLGTGRCKYHGGATPRKHGIFSRVVPKEMTASYVAALADPNLNSMREHLALIDGVILPGALKRGEKAPKHAGGTDPLMVQMMAIDTKSKILKRVADIEDRGKIKMSPSDIKLFVMEIVGVVAEYVDASTLRKIADRFGVRTDNSKPLSVSVCSTILTEATPSK